MKIILKGAFLGALIFAVWSIVSWDGLKWYRACIKQFENERFVSWVIRENAKQGHAVYLLPYPFDQKKSSSDAPFFYAAISPRGGTVVSVTKTLIGYGVMAFVMGGITWMMTLVKPVGYWRKVIFLTCIGAFADIMIRFPQMIWYGFSPSYTWMSTLNATVGFFLAALLIASFMRESKEEIERQEAEELFE
ncbi:MAG: hypothetical protein P0S94_04805 [Simkaniaceae bacterium]|nr:hypothetical protein [Simkaniaceae bacterium]